MRKQTLSVAATVLLVLWRGIRPKSTIARQDERTTPEAAECHGASDPKCRTNWR